MFSFLVKWPEKAVSGSSRELAQLSFLVQVEKAACVTSRSARLKWRTGLVQCLKIYCWCSFTTTQQESLAAMQAAVRKVKGAEGTG
jgi:hypothetical protein